MRLWFICTGGPQVPLGMCGQWLECTCSIGDWTGRQRQTQIRKLGSLGSKRSYEIWCYKNSLGRGPSNDWHVSFVVYDISGVTENGSSIFQYSGLFIVCHCLWVGCSRQVLSCHFLIPAPLLCLAFSVWKKKTGWEKCAGGVCLNGTLQEPDFSQNICACVAPAPEAGQLSLQNRACRNLADTLWFRQKCRLLGSVLHQWHTQKCLAVVLTVLMLRLWQKKILSCMDLPYRLCMALGPLADPPKWNHTMVSIPSSVPVVYSLSGQVGQSSELL